MNITDITEALSHPSARSRVAHMTELRRLQILEEKAARFNQAWWHDHEAGPVTNSAGRGGCAVVGCIAFALLIYAALAWAWIR